MSFDLNSILRPHLKTLKPYTSARDEYSGKEGIFLDANENPHGSITEQDFNRYPDPYQKELKSKLASIKQVRPSQIFLGNGSDEAIDLLIRAFCEPGKDHVILNPPTYGMYEVSSRINNVEIQYVSLTPDYQLQPDEIRRATNENSKILFLCSPNNPTGNSLDRNDILKAIEDFPGIVVVDEAYVDFMEQKSLVAELDKFPNLVVIQTFSKAWGLASLRLGMAFASEEIIAVLNKIKPPYNISGLTQDTLLKALPDIEKVDLMVKDILEEREEMRLELEEMPGVEKIYPSDANFLLIRIPNANQAYEDLIARKVITRNRSKVQLCENSLRITIGTKEENRIFLDELISWLGSN